MRAVLQRVAHARVTVDDREVASIGRGLLAYVAAAPLDGEREVAWMARKLTEIRVFGDDEGRMNRSVADVGGAVLLVSQFTLYADTRRGRRPSFFGAAPPERAAPMLDDLAERIRGLGVAVASGRFGAHMLVDAVNDGPVTILLDSEDLERARRD